MSSIASRLLSPREVSVSHMTVWGYSNKEIASRLTISVKTVEAHKSNAMRKLRLTSRADLVRYAIAAGWLTPDSEPKRDDAAHVSGFSGSMQHSAG